MKEVINSAPMGVEHLSSDKIDGRHLSAWQPEKTIKSQARTKSSLNKLLAILSMIGIGLVLFFTLF